MLQTKSETTVQIDGSHGEGGGQIIRTSLALSLVTRTPFRIDNVRANRTPGGLRPQHLAAVKAAAEIGNATVDGAQVGAESFTFHPGDTRAGHYEFDIGTAGSSTMVLQTVLPPLLLADGPSTVVIEGGTHNAHAPPVEFLADTFLPLLDRLGARVRLQVVRYGSYPHGGGRIDVEIDPIRVARPLHLTERVHPTVTAARALVVRLPDTIAERELAVVGDRLGLRDDQLHIVRAEDAAGPTNAVVVSARAGELVETISAIGQRGMPAEDVALAAITETRDFLARGVPVGEHLADQLLVPLALAAGGSFLTCPVTRHTTTNVNTIRTFLHADIRIEPEREGAVRISVEAARDHARSADDDRPIVEEDLVALGLDRGPLLQMALQAANRAVARRGRALALADLVQVVSWPESNDAHPEYGELARSLGRHSVASSCTFRERDTPAPFESWCVDVEEGAAEQMQHAMRLPSAVRGALMPDAHRGYGLPIGGVLATDNVVVPYAVGVDIACRMKLSVLDVDVALLERDRDRVLEKALIKRTKFGSPGEQGIRERPDHAVLDVERWRQTDVTSTLRDRAWGQLGTSGGGNHFVEFGLLTLEHADLGLQPGRYVALLSHSGSRGAGAQVARWFTARARELHPELPPELQTLAWLDLDSDDGRDYWRAMQLMGDYAAACHEVIHERVRAYLGAQVLATVENHHNFAWIERHDDRDVVVHRKGATPAGEGVLGVIPGSMASPAFVVRGRGDPRSLRSASHGAGRVMSRTAARQEFKWQDVTPLLRAARVKLISGGIDENPLVYKNIFDVMAQQQDLVEVVARFDPRVVRMES